mmetsp:Transcript_18460/g.50688  ORF Transcript_18460/g.50688 Transcript_18460/m.50688 type:complete len:312 (+) Transcript_18460:59-994(+)
MHAVPSRAVSPVGSSHFAAPTSVVYPVVSAPGRGGAGRSSALGARLLPQSSHARCLACTLAAGELLARRGRRSRRRSRAPPRVLASAKAKAQTERPEDFEPVSEYRVLKEDFIGGWGALVDEELAVRLLGLFGAGLLPGLSLASAVFPVTRPETGELLPRNVAASGLFGAGLSMLVVVAVLVYILGQWDTVHKALLKTSYVVEGRSPDQRFSDGGFYSYVQEKSEQTLRRDRLLAAYSTEPVLGRVRRYLIGGLAATALMWTGGSLVGGEFVQEEPPEQEDDAPDEYGRVAKFYKAPSNDKQTFFDFAINR